MSEHDWQIEVSSADLELVRGLTAVPDGSPLRPDAPTRIPGAVETLAFIHAHADAIADGVIGSLIAAWLWSARDKAKGKVSCSVTLKRPGKRWTVKVEGDSEAGVAQIVAEAFHGADLHS